MGMSLELKGIGKTFPGVRALDDISFRADGGKVIALIGENGAGKSTLLKILNGDLQPDEGEILLNGNKVHFASPQEAIKAGISIIYQERQLISEVSVMENIFIGDLPKTSLGFFDKKKLYDDAKEIIDTFGLDIDPRESVGRLSVAHQQMVEIMKSYRRDSDIIAYDESTAPLTDTEIKVLFDLIRQQKEQGKVIIYVSHRLSELFEISDEIVVLKDGKYVKTFETKKTTEAELIYSMVGREIGDTYSNLVRNDNFGEVILETKDLRTPYVSDISFSLRKGEILGFAGLVGAGRTEVARALFGADPVLSGEIILEGKSVRFKNQREAIDAGIALCPEDRKEQGLVLLRSIRENVMMSALKKLCSVGSIVDKKETKELAKEAVEKFSIKTPSIEKLAGELSGGNQQKVILGRWTSSKMDTKILILDEPTKGIDVGTKAEIYQMICDFARQGLGIILISSELPEVINIADNIIVMHNGHITGKLKREEATEENVLALAMKE